MFSLKGKVALVTGGASGIGYAIADKLSLAGAHVIIADREEEAGRKATETLANQGRWVTFMTLDVTSVTSHQKLQSAFLESRFQLDILVNNAGIGHVGTILETKGEDLERLLQVNVMGVFHGCKTWIPYFLERGQGNIINMASIGGLVGLKDRLAYNTSKFAVVGLTKSIAIDHARQGIRCNCICPGRVETPFVQSRLKEYPDPEKAYREMSDSQEVGRMGKPEEIASLALYLASEESAFVTGSSVVIDGGLSIGK